MRKNILYVLLLSAMLLAFGQAHSSSEVTITANIEATEPTVETHPATAIGTDSANLHGELTSLGPEPEADVFFQYREKESPFWQETPLQTATSPVSFSVTLTGLSEDTAHEFRAGVEWNGNRNFGETLEFTTGKETPPLPPSRPSKIEHPSVETVAVFEGKAYPNASLSLLKDGLIAAEFSADLSGLFKKELPGISGGTHNFGIWAEDTDGRRSATLGFTVFIPEGSITTVSDIFLSPTIEISPTEVERGDSVNIFGQAFPGSRVEIFISSKKTAGETKAGSRGKWSFALDTDPLEEGDYRIRAKAFFEEKESIFSHYSDLSVLPPGIITCRGADLNFDGRVDIIDFSILLYFWGQSKPANPCADINFDGIVDIMDFSIMMYWWTG